MHLVPFRRKTARAPNGVKHCLPGLTDDELSNIIDNTTNRIGQEQEFLHVLLAEQTYRRLGVDRTTAATLF